MAMDKLVANVPDIDIFFVSFFMVIWYEFVKFIIEYCFTAEH